MTTSKEWIASAKYLLVVVFFAVVVLPVLVPRENPYEIVIAEIAASEGWDRGHVQMLNGEHTELSLLRWTRVNLVIRNEVTDVPVYVTARKGPFAEAYLSCYSVVGSEYCTT